MRLLDAMRDLNAGVQFAAKTGLEVDLSRVGCHATYSAEPLLRLDVAANPGKRPILDAGVPMRTNFQRLNDGKAMVCGLSYPQA